MNEVPAFVQARLEKWIIDAMRGLLAEASDGSPATKDLVVRAVLKATVEFASKHRSPAEVAGILRALAEELER